jgi:SAM-dependent methyltransferase
MKLFRIRSRDEYLEHVAKSDEYLSNIKRFENEIIPKIKRKHFKVKGFSYPAGCTVNFFVGYEFAYPGSTINWREHLRCSKTGLNNRMRAAIHIFDTEMAAHRSDRIYISEQITAMYLYFKTNYMNVIGSEYLGCRCLPGTNDERGIRNEDLTKLSFPDSNFDRAISLDCLEHFPDYKLAFNELFRILRPNGKLLLSVPFDTRYLKNLKRAIIKSSGEIEYLQPPEFHGDPLQEDGCLCFTHFGWEILDQLKDAGFSDAYAVLYWSALFGYLGGEQIIFVAQK